MMIDRFPLTFQSQSYLFFIELFGSFGDGIIKLSVLVKVSLDVIFEGHPACEIA